MKKAALIIIAIIPLFLILYLITRIIINNPSPTPTVIPTSTTAVVSNPVPTHTTTPIPTNTPSSTPTHTLTPSITALPTEPLNTATMTSSSTITFTSTATNTPQPILSTPVPPSTLEVLQPVAGQCYNSSNIFFEWKWDRLLQDGPFGGQQFAIRIWALDGEKRSIHWTKDNNYSFDALDPHIFLLEPMTRYFFDIAVVEPYADPPGENWNLIDESSIETFIYQCEPPPPTNTPAPMSTATRRPP